MGKFCQLGRQDVNFFVDGFVFIHDKQIPALDLAQTTLYLYAGSSKILFRDGDLKLFRQIFKRLVNLFGFHISLVRLDLEKSGDCVILST